MTASQFVLLYDAGRGRLAGCEEFSDPESAANAVLSLEQRYRDDGRMHVVMLAGDSFDSLKATHGTYFDEPFAFVGDLVSNGVE